MNIIAFWIKFIHTDCVEKDWVEDSLRIEMRRQSAAEAILVRWSRLMDASLIHAQRTNKNTDAWVNWSVICRWQDERTISETGKETAANLVDGFGLTERMSWRFHPITNSDCITISDYIIVSAQLRSCIYWDDFATTSGLSAPVTDLQHLLHLRFPSSVFNPNSS